MRRKQDFTRNTPETLEKITNSRNSSEIKPIDRYTGLSTPALKPIGMMMQQRSAPSSIVSNFDEVSKNNDIRISVNQQVPKERVESLQADNPANR